MEQLKANQEKIVDSEQKEKAWSKKVTHYHNIVINGGA